MLTHKVTPAPKPQPVKAERPVAEKPRDLTLPVMRGTTADFGVI
ncbi:hypothetical protein [Deinococcus aestuarii]|nr:hypothetical protein [Deinococcus aestuarii]